MSSFNHHLKWLMAKEMMEKLFATIKKNGLAILPLICFINDLFLS
jgi:tmRNA-binding protein